MATEPASSEASDVVSREIRIEATRETVFSFFTDPEKMARWHGISATLNPEPGGVFRVEIREGSFIRGAYLSVEPPERVSFSWGWEGDDPMIEPGGSTVEVELVNDDGATIVRLTHSGIPEGEARRLHGIGWDHYLGRLAVAAPGGDPGPDTAFA